MIKVVSPIDGTPAARAGLRSGDVITSLDKKQVLVLTLQEAVDKMRGPPRAPITLTIVRKGVDHPIDVTLIRSVIHVIPVKYRAEDDVGYIYISFNEQTTPDLQKAIEGLKRQIGPKLKGFIIDLRTDPEVARPGDRSRRCVPRPGHDRDYEGPRRDAEVRCESRRHH